MMINRLFRHFSKTAKRTGVSTKKEKVYSTLRNELLTNPGFDRAFPHLLKYKGNTMVPRDKKELDFIRSLFYKWRATGEISGDEIIQGNVKLFSEGFHYPKGPLKYLSDEDKLRVHIIADIKLEEIEETGLSREEYLEPESGKVGIVFGEDPFFQYVKTNYLAREIMISPNELFTPEKIINLALRQNITVDDASSVTKKRILKREELNYLKLYNMENTPSKKEKLAEPEDYYSGAMGVNWQDYQEENYLSVPVPLHKGIIKNMGLVPYNPNDLHWRNTALLVQFINSCAKIRGHCFNRLSKAQNTRAAQVIKHARNMKLLPHNSFVRPHHKISLRSLEEDIQNAAERKVDLETGAMVVIQPDDEWTIDENEDFEEEEKRLMEFDFSIPANTYFLTNMSEMTKAQEKLFYATKYANLLAREEAELDGVDVKELDELSLNSAYNIDDRDLALSANDEEIEQCKEAFEDICSRFGRIGPQHLIRARLVEGGLSYDGMESLREEAEYEQNVEEIDIDTDQLLRELKELKKEIVAGKEEEFPHFASNVVESGIFEKFKAEQQAA